MSEKETPRKLKQYIELTDIDEVNKYAELGYRLHSLTIHQINYPDSGSSNIKRYIMYLDKGNYEDITHLTDVAPRDVDLYLSRGWEITSTSLSTKFVRMIHRGEPNTGP